MTRTYTLNTEWTMQGKLVSDGNSLGEVMTKAFESDSLPDDGSYSDDSFDVRTDYIEIVTDETVEILGCENCGKPLRIITRGSLGPESAVVTNSVCDMCGAEHTIIYEGGLS